MMTTTNLIDLRQARTATPDNLPGLQAYLALLVGEPFRFARVSYGDELTLHFGDLRPARSPKLRGRLYGAYVVGARGSPWVLKSGSEPLVLTAGVDLGNVPSELGKPVSKKELESNPLIQPESRVLSVTPFVVKPVNGFGLQIRVSDGSTLLILPAMPDVEEPDDETLPELADWELSSPGGFLSAGPGLVWSFTPSSDSRSHPEA
jgi:hypothetical protein